MDTKAIKEEVSDRDRDTTSVSSTKDTPPVSGQPQQTARASSRKGGRVHQSPASPEGAPASPRLASHNGADPATPPQHNGQTSPTALSQSLSVDPPSPTSASSTSQRPLAKVKRFLSTLVQFGRDISAETGERVKALVISLVGSSLTVEEFHRSLQEVTNFPLRPFVLPFLRAQLPALQRQLAAHASRHKQSVCQYVRQHEHSVLDPSCSPSEPGEIFQHTEGHHAGPDKRRAPPDSGYYDTGGEEAFQLLPPPAKQRLLFPLHPPLPPLAYPLLPEYPPLALPLPHASAEDEWKNIHVMLNCILSMVEKTKRALSILQQRAGGGGDAAGVGAATVGGANAAGRPPDDVRRTAGEIMAQTIRLTEDRVAEVRRKAEEAVNEVKRQAVAELQRAVAAAESRACELVAAERAKVERLVAEAARKAAAAVAATDEATDDRDRDPQRDTPPATAQHNSCWNCGRKANETCSGCNTARYCGAFCQHKDWETHHAVCCATRDKRATPAK